MSHRIQPSYDHVIVFAFVLHAICFSGIAGPHAFSFSSGFLIFFFPPPTPKHCLTATDVAPAAFNSLVASLLPFPLSMHGIQIISRASLCCCMEGMGVFELDLLDNIRSTQISFHARFFHVDTVAHTGLWLLIFLRTFYRES